MENKQYGLYLQVLDNSNVLRSDYSIVDDNVAVLQKNVNDIEYSKQMQYDITFLKIAQLLSQNSYASRRKVGCVITKNNSIISDGYNGTPVNYHTNECEDENGETKWEVLHAEANAITKLAKSTQSSEGATLYITFSPCKQCSKLVLQSGITRVVFIDEHSDTSGLELLARAGVEICRYFL